MNLVERLSTIVSDVLQLPKGVVLGSDTLLLGAIAELDSMAVVSILTIIEEDFGIEIYDDEISADIFETFGTLSAFIESKVAQ